MSNMTEEKINPKRLKLENEVHIGEDLSTPNTKLFVSINRKLYLDEDTADVHFLFEQNGSDIVRIPATNQFCQLAVKFSRQCFMARFQKEMK